MSNTNRTINTRGTLAGRTCNIRGMRLMAIAIVLCCVALGATAESDSEGGGFLDAVKNAWDSVTATAEDKKVAAENKAMTVEEKVLLEAARSGQTQWVIELLQSVSDVSRAEDVVAALLKAGGDVNEADEYGTTLLLWAVGEGHVDMVKALLAAGADVNKAGNYGYTPLHRSACGRADIIKALIAAGADVNKTDKNGWPPSLCGSAPSVRAMVAAGANVNAVSRYGRTPLHGAATGGRADTAKALIAAGADVNKADTFNHTPLEHLANWDYYPEKSTVVELEAHMAGRVDVIKLLVAAGADVNRADEHGWTPLFLAVRAAGRIEHKITVSEKIINMVLRNGYVGVLKALLDAGADVNWATNKYGNTALHLWAEGRRGSHADVLKALVAAGADVNATNRYGDTPLYYGIKEDDPDVVKALIAAGADVNWANEDGETYLDIMHLASQNTRERDITNMLRRAGGRCNKNC